MTNEGVTGGLSVSTAESMIIAAFVAIGWYNHVELSVVMFTTFRRFRGLYFWSLLVSTWGIVVFSLAFLMKFYRVWTNGYMSVVFITIGWYAMVTGQSFVLFSRLHLIVRDHRKVRWVLYMIIINVVLFHFPTTALTFGSNGARAEKFTYPYMVMERIQVTAFSIQEFIISALYVYETRRLLKPSEAFQKKRTRRVMMHLIYVNILIILMDITLLCTQYVGLYHIQITYKGAVYSVKLKLEFAILNQLMDLAKAPAHGGRQGDGFTGNYSSSQREIPLYRMDNPNVRPNGAAAGEQHLSPVGYTFTAGRAAPSGQKMHDNCVLRTTEVNVVSTERVNANVTELDKKDGDKVSTATVRPGDTETGLTAGGVPKAVRIGAHHSPSSSELEFAGAGY